MTYYWICCYRLSRFGTLFGQRLSDFRQTLSQFGTLSGQRLSDFRQTLSRNGQPLSQSRQSQNSKCCLNLDNRCPFLAQNETTVVQNETTVVSKKTPDVSV